MDQGINHKRNSKIFELNDSSEIIENTQENVLNFFILYLILVGNVEGVCRLVNHWICLFMVSYSLRSRISDLPVQQLLFLLSCFKDKYIPPKTTTGVPCCISVLFLLVTFWHIKARGTFYKTAQWNSQLTID